MSRSVKQDYDQPRAKQTAAQYARDQIAAGADPQTEMHLVFAGVPSTVTYEEAAELAFIGDIIDKELAGIIERTLP